MIDIKAIKAAAEAANQTKWQAYHDHGWLVVGSDDDDVYVKVAKGSFDTSPDATHIATANPATVIALCDEIERLQQQVTIYEKHGVTCQTFGHKLTGCAECNRDDAADDAMALDTLKLQARQYFELLPEVERLEDLLGKAIQNYESCADKQRQALQDELVRLFTPLTDEQIKRVYHKFGGDMINCARSIERQHGIGVN